MRILDMIGALVARAVVGAWLTSALDGLARFAVVTLLWGWPRAQHEIVARLLGFGMASACVLSLGHACALAARPLWRGHAWRAALAGAAGQATALAILWSLTGPAGQADLDLPLLRTWATLAFGAALGLAAHAADAAVLGGAGRSGGAWRAGAWRGALIGGAALALIHALAGEAPPGVPCDAVTVGGGAGVLAGLADGLALGAALGAVSGLSFAPQRWARRAVAAGLALALAVAAYQAVMTREVEARIAALEPLVLRVRALPRMADPLFARWLSDVRTREEKALDSARRFPWYLLRLQPRLRAEVHHALDVAELILRALLGEKITGTPTTGSAAHLLALVSDFRVPAALEWQEHFHRDVLAVYRGGVPLFALTAGLPGARDARAIAQGFRVALPSGRTATGFRRGLRSLLLADGWVHDIWAPTQELRLRVLDRLLAARPLAPGDDLVDATVLIPPGDGPGAQRARADIDPRGPAMATARAWLASGLHPYCGDVHTHASSTLGGSVPPEVAAANTLSMFTHFHALTEHFSAYGNAPVAAWMQHYAPGSTFLPGEEITVGAAHVTALGLDRWIPTPWHTFTAPPDPFIARINALGAVPVLAHAHYPMNEWQRAALADWRGHGLAACELTPWMDDGVYEAMRAPPPALGGSDAHCGCFAGAARTLLLATDPSPAALLAAIRAGRCVALRLDQPLLARGSPAMRAALWLLLDEPGRLERELTSWRGATVGLRPAP